MVAFEAYGQLSKVSVRAMTVISGFDDMHEDICNTAAEKRVAIIILPFHKYQRVDGQLEVANPGFQMVNQLVLQHAPCSVGILVDRGLGGSTQLSPSSVDHNVAVLFFGGPDDRESLVFGCRMAEHPGVKLTVINFVEVHKRLLLDGRKAETEEREIGSSATTSPSYHFAIMGLDLEEEFKLDQECLAVVRKAQQKRGQGNVATETALQSIEYEEVVVVDDHDPIEAVVGLARKNKFDLILVGRARRPSPMVVTSACKRCAECSELGPIADALTSSSWRQEIRASVLVIQQHDPALVSPPPPTTTTTAATTTAATPTATTTTNTIVTIPPNNHPEDQTIET